MGSEDRFERVCRVLNKVLDQRRSESFQLEVDNEEANELISALEYLRETINPGSGDEVAKAEYNCPHCGSYEVFRAQERNASLEAEHDGLEVLRVEGIAKCSSCLTQVDLKKFQAIKLNGYDEETWQDLYREEYQGREKAEKLE